MYNIPCNISLCYSGRAFLKSVGVFPLLSGDFGSGPSNCLGCWHISGSLPAAFSECCIGKASVSPPLRKHLMCCSCSLICWSEWVDPAAQCLFTHTSFEFTSAKEFVQKTWLWHSPLEAGLREGTICPAEQGLLWSQLPHWEQRHALPPYSTGSFSACDNFGMGLCSVPSRGLGGFAWFGVWLKLC